jgi:hypothetical protein
MRGGSRSRPPRRLGHEQVDLAVERVEVERHEHRPVAREPLRHFAAEIPRD